MCRATVPQRMRTSLATRCRAPRTISQPTAASASFRAHSKTKFAPLHSRNAPTPGRPIVEIMLQSINRRPPHRNNPFLIALPSHLRQSLIQPNIFHPQRHNLSHAQPAAYSSSRIAWSRSARPSASGARAAAPIRSNISVISPSANDFGNTFQLAGVSIFTGRIICDPFVHRRPPVKPPQTLSFRAIDRDSTAWPRSPSMNPRTSSWSLPPATHLFLRHARKIVLSPSGKPHSSPASAPSLPADTRQTPALPERSHLPGPFPA